MRFLCFSLFIFVFFSNSYAFSNAYVADLEENVRFLYGRVEELEKKVALLMDAIDSVTYEDARDVDLDKRFVSREMEGFDVSEGEAVAYKEALNKLRVGDLENAADYLLIFIDKYPASQLIGNVYFWLGEIYSNARDYKKSAHYFLKAYKNAKTDMKKHSSIYKLAVSLNELGDSKNACKVINKMFKDFGNDMTTFLRRDVERYINKIKECHLEK